ncbi:MAG: Lrp/AsnC ligand binding domain-containing protein [Candidatus Bathyarchaeia archaeon]|jgi:DNA-binding Lrp family transcriptional regulator
MPTACVLLNTEIGAENKVLKEIKAIDGVEEAHILWGVYDIIANVKADTMDKLKEIISDRFGEISQIHSKLTMITSEHAPVMRTQTKPEAPAVSKKDLMPIFA